MITLAAIIPCYNFEKYITDAVDSVLSQVTNFDIKIYIIDDVSTDRTYDIVQEKYKNLENVKIFQAKQNQGITKNLREIFSKIDEDYIFLIDGDDYLADKNYFQRAVDFLENNKNYAMFCSGYKWLHNDGRMEPSNGIFMSNIEDVSFNDILSVNYITVGRIFRNYKEIVKPWIHDDLHEDWAINAEILKNGLAKCERSFVGVYRITKSGRITSLNEAQINEKNNRTISAIKQNIKPKVITIVDSFVHNDRVKEKLCNTLNWLEEDGHEILLITNTSVDKDILNKTKFCIYDSRNQLFEEKYEIGNVVDFWHNYYDGKFEIHTIIPETQKHGLSVLINLFNALSYAKEQGYTHFQRVEPDDLYGEKSREYIKNIPNICQAQGKKGLFYFNEDNNPKDASFHYFYSDIELFLRKVIRISSEKDYVEYLQKFYSNKSFKIVEVFIYDNLKKSGDSEFLIKNGKSEMFSDFSDTLWNTETSVTSFDPKYKKCVTKLYFVNEFDSKNNSYYRGNSYILHSRSYTSEMIVRTIEVEKNNGEKFNLQHSVADVGAWTWHELQGDVKSISVYENGNLLYKDFAADCISYVNIKRI